MTFERFQLKRNYEYARFFCFTYILKQSSFALFVMHSSGLIPTFASLGYER